ncbi:MarR family winged helix-turn-helix transcriptional regulator [Marinobacterium arenosum]|uniref:MarR family winged helix-turn-helix transcriptional regulator n=1 Tax=Marinobacterium arenosum TaxID=2862496 RepID=UPI001C94E9EA|nr:MarR family transcriptional regulator [Marinobacterium arenosum]MBY4678898.1 winged helix DNA-binding protein [Marinobacterium arenosum]
MSDGNNELKLKGFFPYRLSVLEKQVSEAVAAVYQEQHALTRYEWRVLAALGQNYDVLSAKQIAAYTRMEKMQVSRAITRLKERDLLEQGSDQRDRRFSRVQLTEQGKALYRSITPDVLAREQAILQGLSSDEREQLFGLLEKLEQHIEQLPSS